MSRAETEPVDHGRPADGAASGSVFLITDCGSTTTKAVLIGWRQGSYRLLGKGEAPTTVEAPQQDVMEGVRNAVTIAADRSGRRLLRSKDATAIRPAADREGVDHWLSTSSAGGGLQMLVVGVVRNLTAESAERAALGAGAIVTDVLAFNDGRLLWQQMRTLAELRPDMILLSGGVDGGSRRHVLKMAEMIATAGAGLRPGGNRRLPVVFAGNRDAWPDVARLLQGQVDLVRVENIRPDLERENLLPARRKIHALFLDHVMARAPGYDRLVRCCRTPILPTPAAVGQMVERLAADRGCDLLAVDIGGATTDVFSVCQGEMQRSVSANLGLSYSIANVAVEAGLAAIRRWLPFDLPERELRNRLKNKMLRPTVVPHTLEDLAVEQAVAREALRLALQHHRSLRTDLKGGRSSRGISQVFGWKGTNESRLQMLRVEMIVGSGGVLAYAPLPRQAAAMLIDGLQPEGVTELALDAAYLLPQLGVLDSICPEAVQNVLARDALVALGTCIAPVTESPARGVLAHCRIEWAGGEQNDHQVYAGQLVCLASPTAEAATVTIRPARHVDCGSGSGTAIRREVRAGAVGIILDGRGRPLRWPDSDRERLQQAHRWQQALGCYPADRWRRKP